MVGWTCRFGQGRCVDEGSWRCKVFTTQASFITDVVARRTQGGKKEESDEGGS